MTAHCRGVVWRGGRRSGRANNEARSMRARWPSGSFDKLVSSSWGGKYSGRRRTRTTRLIGISPFHLRCSGFSVYDDNKVQKGSTAPSREAENAPVCFVLVFSHHVSPRRRSRLVLNGGRDRNFDLISLKGAFHAHHSVHSIPSPVLVRSI